jgi:hypothetical protein
LDKHTRQLKIKYNSGSWRTHPSNIVPVAKVKKVKKVEVDVNIPWYYMDGATTRRRVYAILDDMDRELQQEIQEVVGPIRAQVIQERINTLTHTPTPEEDMKIKKEDVTEKLEETPNVIRLRFPESINPDANPINFLTGKNPYYPGTDWDTYEGGIASIGPLYLPNNKGEHYHVYKLGTCRGHMNDLLCDVYRELAIPNPPEGAPTLHRRDRYTQTFVKHNLQEQWFEAPYIKIAFGYNYPLPLNTVLEDNNLINLINWMEEALGIEDRTTIIEETQFHNILVVNMPNIFIQASPLYSMYTLMIRTAQYYKGGDPEEFLKAYCAPNNMVYYGSDKGYVTNMLKLLPLFKEHGVKPWLFRQPAPGLGLWGTPSTHDWGIGVLRDTHMIEPPTPEPTVVVTPAVAAPVIHEIRVMPEPEPVPAVGLVEAVLADEEAWEDENEDDYYDEDDE